MSQFSYSRTGEHCGPVLSPQFPFQARWSCGPKVAAQSSSASRTTRTRASLLAFRRASLREAFEFTALFQQSALLRSRMALQNLDTG